MSRAPVPPERPRSRVVAALARTAVLAAWAAGAVLGGPLQPTALGLRLAFAVAGLAVAVAAVLAWDERVQPGRGGWWLLVSLGVLGLLSGSAGILLVTGLAAGLAVVSDHPRAPGTLVVTGTVAVLWRDPDSWDADGALAAWLLAFGTLLALAAAAAERERQARAATTPTPAAWLVIVFVAVAAWTAAILALRHALRGVDLLPFLDSGSAAGRGLLAGLILVCVAAAGLLLRGRKAPT